MHIRTLRDRRRISSSKIYIHLDPGIRPPETEANSESGYISWPDTETAEMGTAGYQNGLIPGVIPGKPRYQAKLSIWPAGYRGLSVFSRQQNNSLSEISTELLRHKVVF